MKKISFWGLIIVVIISLVFFLNNFYKESQVKTINKEQGTINNETSIDIDIIPNSISITKTGNPVRKKNVTSSEDMDKIMSFIKSIDMKEKLDGSYKGWGYSINIEDLKGETHQISISSDKISYNNSFYTTDISVSEKIRDIYNQLNYPEIDPLN